MAIVAVGLIGCASSVERGQPVSSARKTSVAIIADSITSDAIDDVMVEFFARGATITNYARPGSRVADHAAEFTSVGHGTYDAVVVELGTNDIWPDPDDALREYDAALQQLRRIPCVIAVNVGVVAIAASLRADPKFHDHFAFVDRVAAFNAQLAQLVSGYRNAHLLDWNSMYNAHPMWSRDTVNVDGPHARDYSAFLASGLDAC